MNSSKVTRGIEGDGRTKAVRYARAMCIEIRRLYAKNDRLMFGDWRYSLGV